MCVIVCLESLHWTLALGVSVVGTVAFWFVFLEVYHTMLTFSPNVFGIVGQLVNTATFWSAVLLVPFVLGLVNFVPRYWRANNAVSLATAVVKARYQRQGAHRRL